MKTFLINTSDEIGQQRLPVAMAELEKYGIKAKRYEAIYNKKCGWLGLIQTMRILFEENRNEDILIFEDDIVILREDFNEIFGKVLEQLPNDFDCLYLGCNLLVTPTKVSDNILKVSSAYSSHAVLYSKKCIDLMLSLWDEKKPYDGFLLHKIQPYGKCFCTFPMLVSQRKGVSNIFEYEPLKQVGIESIYDVKTKEIDWGLFMKNQFELLTKNL